MKYNKNNDKEFWNSFNFNCNCGSYALNLKEWFHPYGNDEKSFFRNNDERVKTMSNLIFDRGYEINDLYEIILKIDTNEILRLCPWIEVVDIKDVVLDDTIVAYRLGVSIDEETKEVYDWDFHFRLRENGVWTEKMGAGIIREADEDSALEEICWESASCEYDSPIVFFKVKERW